MSFPVIFQASRTSTVKVNTVLVFSVDLFYYTLRVKRDAPCSALSLPSRQFAFRNYVASCSFPWTSSIARFALNGLLRAPHSRFPHGNSHSATTLLHAHFRGHHKRPQHQLCKHMMVRSFLLSLTLKLYSFSGGSSCVVWMFYFGHFGDVVGTFKECVGHVMTCHDDLESAWFVFYEFYQFFFT